MNKNVLADTGTVVSFAVDGDGSKRLVIYDKEGYVADVIENTPINLPFRGRVLIVEGSIILLKSGITSFGLRYLVNAASYYGYSDYTSNRDRWVGSGPNVYKDEQKYACRV